MLKADEKKEAPKTKTIIRIRQSSALPARGPVRVVRTQRLVAQPSSAPASQPPPQIKVSAVEVVPASRHVQVLSPVDYEEEVTVDVVEALAATKAEADEAPHSQPPNLIDEEEIVRAERQVLAAPTRGKRSKSSRGAAESQRSYKRFAATTGPQPHLHKYVTYEEFNRQKADIEADPTRSRDEKGKERKRIADSFEKQKKTLAARILAEQANQVVDLLAARPEVLDEHMTAIILATTANYFKDHYGKDIKEEAERLRHAMALPNVASSPDRDA